MFVLLSKETNGFPFESDLGTGEMQGDSGMDNDMENFQMKSKLYTKLIFTFYIGIGIELVSFLAFDRK